MEKQNIKEKLISIILLSIPGVIGGIFLVYLQKKFEINTLKQFIISNGCNAVFIFIAIFILRTFLIVAPYYMMLVIGGILFGLKLGLLLNISSALVSASIAFFVSRSFKATPILRTLNGKYGELISKMENNGFRIILFMRLTLVFPFDILNYTFGLTKIKYKDFFLGNFIGIIPEVLFLTIFGALLLNPGTVQFYITLFSLVNITIIVSVYKKQIQKTIQYIMSSETIPQKS